MYNCLRKIFLKTSTEKFAVTMVDSYLATYLEDVWLEGLRGFPQAAFSWDPVRYTTKLCSISFDSFLI
jgi:hypothetical protein